MSSTYKPRRIWLWLRALGVVALGLLALPLLSTAAGAHSEYGGPSQPVGTQAAAPQSNGVGAGDPATSDTTTTTTDSPFGGSLSTDGMTGQDTRSAGTPGTGPAFLVPGSTSSAPDLAGPNSAESSVAPESAATSDTSAPAGGNMIVVRKHADTLTGRLIDTASFQLWKDNGNGVLDTPSGSVSSTSTSTTASSLTTASSATSPTAVDTPTRSVISTSGGTATWSALPVGKYIVQEVEAPSGYQLPSANDSPVELTGSPSATVTRDFADVTLSTSPAATTTSPTEVSTATSTPGSGAVGLAPPAGSTGGGTLPGVGAPAHLLPVGLAGLASLAAGGWLLSRRRPRGAHTQP